MPNTDSPEAFFTKSQRNVDRATSAKYSARNELIALGRYCSQRGNGEPLLSKPHEWKPLPKLPQIKF